MREIIFRNKVAIIVYHDPQPKTFKKHIEYLSKHYNFIPLSRLVDAIQNKDWSDIPSKSIVITIDDGHKRTYKLLDVFKTYNIEPTIYICSHIVNTNRHFWWKTGQPNHQRLKKLPHNVMLRLLREEVDYRPEREYSERQTLNKAEIIEMLPYVDFESHTKFHPILTNCSNEKCQDEIENSKRLLEELLNRPVKHFAYPNGAYGEREIKYLKKCGYKSARSQDYGWNSINSDPYKLEIMIVKEDASINKLIAQTSGCFHFFDLLRRKINV